MEIRFWGVRGSIASPGPETATVGGNTSCVEVRCGETRIVLDAGTGLRALGNALLRDEASRSTLTLLLSHLHWDHIQGLPFFVPAYVPPTKLTIVGAAERRHVAPRGARAPDDRAASFPVRLDERRRAARVRARCGRRRSFDVGEATVHGREAATTPAASSPIASSTTARSVVYATDTEHYACVDPGARARSREGADVLIYDSQYTPEEYARRRRSAGDTRRTSPAPSSRARRASGSYVLFHHDPSAPTRRSSSVERARAGALPERRSRRARA